MLTNEPYCKVLLTL